jgi:Family of unknown function (DUF5309)
MATITHVAADAVKYGGLVREDILDQIFEIDNIPLPFTEMCSKGTHTNRRVEFTTDELAAPVTNNAQVEGSDPTGNDGKLGVRIGNYTQIAVKRLILSDTVEAANSIGGAAKFARQVSQRNKELRRDVEAQMLTHQASVAGDANTAAGISAGIGAQLKTNVSVGATGAVGGFNDTTGLFVAPTPGTARALSETLIRDILQQVYEAGGNTSTAMARPVVIRKLSEYLFGATARVATLTSDKAQKGDGGALTAYGSVNVFVTDFGQTITLRDNRIQPEDAAGVSSMYFLDGSHLKQSFLNGYKVKNLGATGLNEKKLLSVEYSLLVLNEKSQGAILAIDEAAAVVA